MARIWLANTMGEATVRVAQVSTRGEADIWVNRVSSFGLASGDALWYIVKDRGEATARIFMTSIGLAQIKVYFVSTRGEAGWRDPNAARHGIFSRP
ncbi:hypothetical protein FHW69_002694 [Luteibacter sp. Sphag1AF]|uniref:DUF6150 family protein n=1 Tax=Luteibacter sp. Sphag1AF TaxID=2587031 RepID=UPI0016097868|nr:DUF6150 family protein [Luteibacter sp. Sphag1AF]MBB3228059.1 hypothetical protein [Luteibacter sp. Sphag1AF]